MRKSFCSILFVKHFSEQSYKVFNCTPKNIKYKIFNFICVLLQQSDIRAGLLRALTKSIVPTESKL